MTITVTPATIVELASLAGATSRLHWRAAREAYAKGETYAFRDGEDLIAIGGFYPWPNDTAEGWFCPCRVDRPENRLRRPDARASDLARAIRLTIRRSPYRLIMVVCDKEAGSRMARAIGFRFAEDTEQGEVWVYGGAVEAGGPRRGRSAGPAAGAAAPDAGADRRPAG